MKKISPANVTWLRVLLLAGAVALPATWALAGTVTLSVVDGNGGPVSGFRWLLEEDTTIVAVPGVQVADSIGLSIHQSYCPVVSTGYVAGASAAIPVPPSNNYVVSILPDAGYTMSSGIIPNGQTSLTIVVNATPVPTAQIKVRAFLDHNPINNAQDLDEPGLAGFAVVLRDNVGQVSQDAFGKPLGTTYQQDTNGNFITDGNGMPVVDMPGSGVVLTDTNGDALVKYMMPARYQIEVIPPKGQTWYQTSTIDGTPFIDAWVKLNEPPNLIEFGMVAPHVSYGFVNPDMLPWAVSAPASGATVTGRLVDDHFSKPPLINASFPGAPVPEGIIGLNDAASGAGLYAAVCNPDGTFTIPSVPPGTYDLITWDKSLDLTIGFNTLIVNAGDTTVALGDVPCLRWHAWLRGSVFYDANSNGFRDAGETGMAEQALNIRNRDGTIAQSVLTDDAGDYMFREIPIFFKWYVAEVNYDRYRPTGITAAMDDGGVIPPANGWTTPSFGILNPQPQYETDPVTGLLDTNLPIINPNTGNNLSRTETGPVLLESMMNFQANVIDWGKVSYAGNENGGIVGIVYYDTTRAEDDPRDGVGEPWEPGIPRVQVNLYQDANNDKVIDDLNGDGNVTLADVDNYPFGWQDGSAPRGPEDVDRNTNDVFNAGDALQIVHSDSWDDNMPAGSIQENPVKSHGMPIKPGYDNFGTWDQVRPGVFDGGYWFNSYFPGGMANTTNEVEGLPQGQYIVEAAMPPGYQVVKSQDRNVLNGDAYTPGLLMLKPECVGDEYVVPQYLALFPGMLMPATFAGATNHLADRKTVVVNPARNANCDFFFFTEVPKAARAVGLVTDDLHANFDQSHPFYGEKATPSWIPVSFQDYAGHEVARVYCDEYGIYNAMVPSTYSVNVPMPSGVSPMMLMVVLNDPTMPATHAPGQRVPDPYYDPDYSTETTTLDFWPAATTYPDTPILPQGAFVGYPYGRMDVEPASGTPVIRAAQGPDGGPLLLNASAVLTISSMGPTQVPNPQHNATNSAPLMITRDFGFGSVTGAVTVNGIALNILSWSDGTITATAPTNAPTGQLMVTRGDNGVTTRIGLTLTVGASSAHVHHVSAAAYPAHPIQDAIDAANPGDLILIGPGDYNENPIMWKPVKLQGSGAQSTFIKAVMNPTERLPAWHAKVQQILGTPGTDPFSAADAPGILVMGTAGLPFTAATAARIDGLFISGAAVGGGIMVYRNAQYTQISNNRLKGNNGSYAGGISVGMPGGVGMCNDRVTIRYNEVLKNSSAGRAGVSGVGGIGMYACADDYEVCDNFIMGNLGTANGAGICHLGLSQRGQICHNKILFNEVVSDLVGVGEGGGIYVAGDPLAGQLTLGAGTLTIDGNLIQGNLSGAAFGGGIRVDAFNGQDVAASPGNSNNWYALHIFNNIIVNNVAGYAGAGISLQDVARAYIIHNTIANNDSTATAAAALPAGATASTPQGAGLVAHAHSALLAAASGQAYAKPTLYDNILWHNRSYYLDTTLNGGVGGLVLNAYWDLQVWGTVGKLDPRSCILTATNGYHSSNRALDPRFANEYVNSQMTASVPDEGGNAVSVRFQPIYQTGDYHIAVNSPAIDGAESSFLSRFSALHSDWDTQYRPQISLPDIGADEYPKTAGVSASNDSYFVVENGFLIVAASGVLTNDKGPGPLTAALVDGTTHGVLSLFSNGSFAYRPNTNFFGTDLFTYRAKSGATNSLPALVTITVRLTNAPPVALDDTYPVNGNGTITVPAPGVLANDYDPNYLPLTAAWIIGPGNGALAFNADGSFTYTPNNGFQGDDTFFYAASNGVFASSPAAVTLHVTTPLPDFAVTAIQLDPMSVDTGMTFTAYVTVTNQGTSGSSAGRLSIWRDQPGADVPFGTAGDAFVDLGSLATGAVTTITFSALAAPPIPPDTDPYPATFRAFINSTGAQAEFQTNNNQRTQMYEAMVGMVEDCPPDLDGIDTDGDGDVSNDYVCAHLTAGDGFVRMADGRDLYCFGFSDVTHMSDRNVLMNGMLAAEAPAPPLVFKEGQRVFLKLTNVGMMMRPDLFDPHSVHFHGFPNAAPIFDGEPMASVAVNMGATFTYYYELIEPGTFMYHCHVEAAEHMQMGMLGILYVQPIQNMLPDGTNLNGFIHHTGYKYAYNDGDGSTYYDRDIPLQITGFDSFFHDQELAVQPPALAEMKDDYPLLNGRGYPDTINTGVIVNVNGRASQKVNAKLVVTAGQKILLRISSLATVEFTTLASSLPMKVVGRSARLLRGPAPSGGGNGKNLYYMTSSVTLGGGESYDAIVDTTGVPAGTYFVYSSNLSQLNNGTEECGGIMTEIQIQ
ncbi:MAG: Ig-like domain-containing protein [bacterium]|nr:Ig-like domain-containing protein [bacterium]